MSLKVVKLESDIDWLNSNQSCQSTMVPVRLQRIW